MQSREGDITKYAAGARSPATSTARIPLQTSLNAGKDLYALQEKLNLFSGRNNMIRGGSSPSAALDGVATAALKDGVPHDDHAVQDHKANAVRQRDVRRNHKRRRRGDGYADDNFPHLFDDDHIQSFPMDRTTFLPLLLHERSVWGTRLRDFQARALRNKFCARQIPFSALETPISHAVIGLTPCGSYILGTGGPIHQKIPEQVNHAVSGERPWLGLRYYVAPSGSINVQRNPSLTTSGRHRLVLPTLMVIPLIYESDVEFGALEHDQEPCRVPLIWQAAGRVAVAITYVDDTTKLISIFPTVPPSNSTTLPVYRLPHPDVLGHTWGIFPRHDGSTVVCLPTSYGFDLYWLGAKCTPKCRSHATALDRTDGDLIAVDVLTGVQVESSLLKDDRYCKPTFAGSISLWNIARRVLDLQQPCACGASLLYVHGSTVRFCLAVASGNLLDVHYNIEKGKLGSSRYLCAPSLKGLGEDVLRDEARSAAKVLSHQEGLTGWKDPFRTAISNKAVVFGMPVMRLDALDYPLSLGYG